MNAAPIPTTPRSVPLAPPVTNEDVAFADEMWECAPAQNTFRRQSDGTGLPPECLAS
jgi:hypothetical protein